ncbi:MAG: acyltransferase [Bacteroidota bacterium]
MTASTSPRLHGLDHLRALAIFIVFFYHYQLPFFGHPAWLTEAAAFGWVGVDLFFVLSGFLISSQVFAAIGNSGTFELKSYFIKRVFRILPAYLVVVAVYFIVPVFRERESLPPLWKFLTFTQNIGLDNFTEGTFSHAWSLCVEEHFYLVLPFTLLAILHAKVLADRGCSSHSLCLAGSCYDIIYTPRFIFPEVNYRIREHCGTG